MIMIERRRFFTKTRGARWAGVCKALVSLAVVVSLAASLCAPAFAVDAPGPKKRLWIAGNPIDAYAIVCGADDYGAAEELARYIEAATGAALPLLPDTEAADHEICVGQVDRIGARSGYGDLKNDGFVVKVTGGDLFIRGDTARGTLYGVYGFLEKYVGWRFIHRDTDWLKPGDASLEEGLFWKYEPPFEYRQLDWRCTFDDAWQAKNGENYLDFPWAGGDSGFVHTLGELSELHNDFTGQPCLSDEAVLETVIKNVCRLLDENPGCRIVSVSQNDNPNYCRCPRCQATDAEEGSPAGTLLRFVNAVADDIKDDYPDVSVETLAYTYTRKAPKLTRPRDNVIIRLCSGECCFSHPLSDSTCPENAAFRQDLAEWGKICDRVYIWDYVTNFANYVAPFPNFRVLRENMRFFAENHAVGMYPEGNYTSESGEFGELRAYLLGRLMWDPYMTEEEYEDYMNDFLEGYYGAAAPYIREFIDFTLAASEDRCFGIWQEDPFDIIPREVYEARFNEIEGWWNDAETAAGENLERVQRSRLQWTYIKLLMGRDDEDTRTFFSTMRDLGILLHE